MEENKNPDTGFKDLAFEQIAISFSSYAGITALVLVTKLLAHEAGGNQIEILDELRHIWRENMKQEFHSKMASYKTLWEESEQKRESLSEEEKQVFEALAGATAIQPPEVLEKDFLDMLDKYCNHLDRVFRDAAVNIYNTQSNSIN